MTTCKDISAKTVATYDTLQQMYVGLGIRRSDAGVHAGVSSSLPSAGLNLAALKPEVLDCFNQIVGMKDNAAGSSPLQRNVREIRELVDYFKTDGNTGDANVITGEEIDAYVNAYGESQKDFNAQEFRDTAVANMAAYLALASYVAGDESVAQPIPAGSEPLSTALKTFNTVQQMYIGLAGEKDAGVRQGVSKDVPAEGLPLGVLTEANLKVFRDAIGWTDESPTSPLAQNASDIAALISYLQTDGNLPGGDAHVITGAEIDAYVRAYVDEQRQAGDKAITFDAQKAATVGNIRAFIESVKYLSNPPQTRTAEVMDAGAASDAGPRVIAEDVVDTGAKPDAGPRVVAENPGDAGVPGFHWFSGDGGRPEEESNAGWIVGLLASFLTGSALGALAVQRYFKSFLGARVSDSAAAPEIRKPATPPPLPREEKLEAPKPAAEQVSPPPLPSKTAPVDDIEKALNEALSAEVPPQEGTAVVRSSTSKVTAENVIMEGAKAQPVNAIDAAVVKLQVVLHYRSFLSESAQRALLKGELMPSGADLVSSLFSREVDEITDRIVVEYYKRIGTSEGKEQIATYWENQKEGHQYIVRRGVPHQLLIEVANAYIDEFKESANSPLAGGEGARLREEAVRDAGEVQFLKDGLRDLMRNVGR